MVSILFYNTEFPRGWKEKNNLMIQSDAKTKSTADIAVFAITAKKMK